jgi:hypothetical protein
MMQVNAPLFGMRNGAGLVACERERPGSYPTLSDDGEQGGEELHPPRQAEPDRENALHVDLRYPEEAKRVALGMGTRHFSTFHEA